MQRLSLALALCLFALCAFAQTPTSGFTFPTDAVFAGAAVHSSLTTAGTPGNLAANGWASYAHLLSQSAGTYSFNSYDVTVAQRTPLQLQVSARTGIMQYLRAIGPVRIFVCADIGAAATGDTTGLALSGCGAAIYQVGKTHWHAVGAVRELRTSSNTQTVYEVGFGRSF